MKVDATNQIDRGSRKGFISKPISDFKTLPGILHGDLRIPENIVNSSRITSYNVCYTKLLRAGRGFWPGLSTTLKHNCRFASYTLLTKGNYPSELNIPLPFSLLIDNEQQNRLEVMPAYWWLYNMYALERNSWKYRIV